MEGRLQALFSTSQSDPFSLRRTCNARSVSKISDYTNILQSTNCTKQQRVQSYNRYNEVLVPGRSIAAAATTKVDGNYSCEFASPMYFVMCSVAGIVSCGITHTMIVPLDVIKCRLQVDPKIYSSLLNGFQVIIKEDGVKGLYLGWAPTTIGYSLQGMAKFGLYEVFKVSYANIAGEEAAFLWRTSLYLAAAASAEVIADIGLCPFEAMKVRMQTESGFANTMRVAFQKIHGSEGFNGLYKGIVPLWLRQIPYTMMKFASFERIVELMYKHVVRKPMSECSKPEQLVLTFTSGYIAGIFCALVSHPADTVVSKLNQAGSVGALEIFKNLGFMGMWKGLGTRIIMVGTLTGSQWFIYDAFKVFFRLPRPPPPEIPESLKRKLSSK